MRYTVTENLHGYYDPMRPETRLCYALCDTQPDKVAVYRFAERGQVLVPNDGTDPAAQKVRPWRHVCFGACKEDLQALADVLNVAAQDVASLRLMTLNPLRQSDDRVFKMEDG